MKLAVLLFCAMVAMAAAYSVGPPKSPKPTMQEEPQGECVLDYFSDSYWWSDIKHFSFRPYDCSWQ